MSIWHYRITRLLSRKYPELEIPDELPQKEAADENGIASWTHTTAVVVMSTYQRWWITPHSFHRKWWAGSLSLQIKHSPRNSGRFNSYPGLPFFSLFRKMRHNFPSPSPRIRTGSLYICPQIDSGKLNYHQIKIGIAKKRESIGLIFRASPDV